MSTRVRTLYLSAQSNLTYKVISVSPIVVRYIHFYNENRTWISAVSRNAVGAYTFTTPANTAFIRIAFQRSNASLSITPVEAVNEGQITLTWNLEQSSEAPAAAVSETNMTAQGQLITGNSMEGFSTAGIRNKGIVLGNEIIEF